jgi:hypothetical protein
MPSEQVSALLRRQQPPIYVLRPATTGGRTRHVLKLSMD